MRTVSFRLCCVLFAIGFADSTARAEPEAEGEQIFVTASRIAEPIGEVVAPVIVIDRDAIERSVATDPAELLRFHAGLDIARNGGPGQTTALFIRGAESNHTLVLVDGVRLNPGTIGLAPLQNISPELIERIEVVKGPRSSLYGSDAIGGVVNIITRRGAARGWIADVGYGDYDTRRASITGGFTAGAAEIDLGLSWLDSDGFPTRTVDDTDSGFENLNGNAQLRGQLGGTELVLRYWGSQGTSEYSDFFLTPVDQDFATSMVSAEARWTPAWAAVTSRYSYLDDRIEQNQSDDYLQTRRHALDLQFDLPSRGRHALSSGAMLTREFADSLSFGDQLDVTTDMVNVFVQDRIDAGAHRGTLALGYTWHETAGSRATWNAEYAYTRGRTQLFALAGTGFRAPDATDRYGFGGNPDLEPERSRSVEAGLRYELGRGHQLGISAFRNDIRDLIEFVTLSYDPFLGENRNVAEALIEGIELSYRHDAGHWWLAADAVFQDPENRDTGEELFRRARRSLTVSAARRFGPFELGADVLAAGERKDFGFPEPVTLDSYVLANLNLRWRIGNSLELAARVENLLDEDYELVHTYNTPGRGLYVSVRYSPTIGRETVLASNLGGSFKGDEVSPGRSHGRGGR